MGQEGGRRMTGFPRTCLPTPVMSPTTSFPHLPYHPTPPSHLLLPWPSQPFPLVPWLFSLSACLTCLPCTPCNLAFLCTSSMHCIYLPPLLCTISSLPAFSASTCCLFPHPSPPHTVPLLREWTSHPPTTPTPMSLPYLCGDIPATCPLP